VRAKKATPTPLLELHGIDLRYGRVQVLFGVDLTIEDGAFVGLLGTNGAGKSTVLRAVSGLSPVADGIIRFAGDDITNLPPDEIAARGLGHVPGGRGTLADLTVEENLRLGGHLLSRSARDEGMTRVVDLFPWMGNRRRQLAGTLSGGEQQMLSIGRALVTQPRLLMVDELSLGLAPVIVQQLMGLLKTLHEQGTTLVIVEQHATLAMEFAHRVVFMEKGRVRFSGAGRDLAGRTDLLRSVFLGTSTA